MSQPRYMLALVHEPSGAFRPINGRIEVRGGKVEKVEIPPLQHSVWLELLIAARVEIEARLGMPSQATDATQRVPTEEGEGA